MALMVEPLRLMPGMQAMPWTVPVTSARHQFIFTPSLSGCLAPVGPHCDVNRSKPVKSSATQTARGFTNKLSSASLKPRPIIAVGILAKMM